MLSYITLLGRTELVENNWEKFILQHKLSKEQRKKMSSLSGGTTSSTVTATTWGGSGGQTIVLASLGDWKVAVFLVNLQEASR